MLELIFGIVIGAAFADFWKDVYQKSAAALKDFMNKPSQS